MRSIPYLLAVSLMLYYAASFAQTPPLEPTALPTHGCSSRKEPADVTDACNRADVAEAKLHAVYMEVFKALAADPVEQRALTEHYANFLESRGPFCQAIAGMPPFGETDFPVTAEDYGCIVDMNGPHDRFLRAWLPGPAPATIAGEYSDGVGGGLTIQGLSKDKAKFKMDVVRSAAFHTGELEGEFTLSPDGKTAKAEIPTSGEEPACVLAFDLKPRRIEVRETNCDYFHGARAYFDGTYRLMTP